MALDVVVVGDSEVEQAVAAAAKVRYIEAPNDPLGSKWQAGIEEARGLDPDGILILGSDTFLSPNWLEVCIPYLEQVDIVGKGRWYVCNALPGKKLEIIQRAYARGQAMSHPVGGGRLIGRGILEKIGWQLFPPFNQAMDTHSLMRMRAAGASTRLLNDNDAIKILGIKGPWETLNPYSRVAVAPGLAKLPAPDQERYQEWLDENFPGAVDALLTCVPGLKI